MSLNADLVVRFADLLVARLQCELEMKVDMMGPSAEALDLGDLRCVVANEQSVGELLGGYRANLQALVGEVEAVAAQCKKAMYELDERAQNDDNDDADDAPTVIGADALADWSQRLRAHVTAFAQEAAQFHAAVGTHYQQLLNTLDNRPSASDQTATDTAAESNSHEAAVDKPAKKNNKGVVNKAAATSAKAKEAAKPAQAKPPALSKTGRSATAAAKTTSDAKDNKAAAKEANPQKTAVAAEAAPKPSGVDGKAKAATAAPKADKGAKKDAAVKKPETLAKATGEAGKKEPAKAGEDVAAASPRSEQLMSEARKNSRSRSVPHVQKKAPQKKSAEAESTPDRPPEVIIEAPEDAQQVSSAAPVKKVKR